MRHPGLAASRERISPGPAEQDKIGSETEHSHHVEAGAHPAVGEYLRSTRDRIGNCGQGPSRRADSVELAAAVIGNDDPVGTARSGRTRIVRIEDALDDQRPFPLGSDPFDVSPADARIDTGADPTHQILERRPGAEEWFEVSKGERTALHCHIPGPAGPGGDLPKAAGFPADRSRQARTIVAVTRAGHREV